jgi:hypothetical protein
MWGRMRCHRLASSFDGGSSGAGLYDSNAVRLAVLPARRPRYTSCVMEMREWPHWCAIIRALAPLPSSSVASVFLKVWVLTSRSQSLPARFGKPCRRCSGPASRLDHPGTPSHRTCPDAPGEPFHSAIPSPATSNSWAVSISFLLRGRIEINAAVLASDVGWSVL